MSRRCAGVRSCSRWPDEKAADRLRKRLRDAGASETEVVWGTAGTVAVATHPEVDFVVSAIVGVAGLEATYEAVKAGKEIGLANKECLVAAGELITAEARRQGKPLLPIDSEHNAVHQCLRGGRMDEVEQVWLTASGGPFLNTPKEEFAEHHGCPGPEPSDLEDGAAHHHRFGDPDEQGLRGDRGGAAVQHPPSRTKVVVHPQSTVHSMVEFVDGSILAQVSVTDMRLPILYALAWPERIASDLRFDVLSLKHLDFAPPDLDKFPCLRLAYEAVEAGGAKTVALNAADEVAVAAFLEGKIPFLGIPATIQAVLNETPAHKPESISRFFVWTRKRANWRGGLYTQAREVRARHSRSRFAWEKIYPVYD